MMPGFWKAPFATLPGFSKRLKIPEFSQPLADGSMMLPEGKGWSGMRLRADGTMKLPDGSLKLPDGRLKRKDGTFAEPLADGAYALSDGSLLLPSGNVKLPTGSLATPSGILVHPDGRVEMRTGTVAPKDFVLPEYDLPCFGVAKLPTGTTRMADGTQRLPNG